MTTDNPFVDPITSMEEQAQEQSFAVDSTLAVGKNASLTLGTDSLIVLGEELDEGGILQKLMEYLDEAFQKRDRSNCCGLWPSGTALSFPLIRLC